MNKKIVYVIVLVILLAGAGLLIISKTNNAVPETNNSDGTEKITVDELSEENIAEFNTAVEKALEASRNRPIETLETNLSCDTYYTYRETQNDWYFNGHSKASSDCDVKCKEEFGESSDSATVRETFGSAGCPLEGTLTCSCKI